MTNENIGIYYKWQDELPPQDWTDYELPWLEVDEELYNTWISNCIKNKTNSSWIYLKNLGQCIRRKVKLDLANKVLIYNGRYKGQWGVIEKKKN